MSFIKRLPTTTNVRTAKWSTEHNAIVYSKMIDRTFKDVALTKPFSMDVWQCMVGWEWWLDASGVKPVAKGDRADTNGTKSRMVDLAPVHKGEPPSPDAKARLIYVMPIYSVELGARHDLIIKDANTSAALDELFDSIVDDAKALEGAGELAMPVIEVSTKVTDDFGTAPVFTAKTWQKRPRWPAPVSFK